MTLSLDKLRRDAKRLKREFSAGLAGATLRLSQHPPRNPEPYLHADFLHVIAQENGFASWPRLKLAAETVGLDRATKQQRLKIALAHGQNWIVERLLEQTPDLAKGSFGIEVALYDRAAVEQKLKSDPGAATQKFGPRSAICHLAFSKWVHARPDLSDDMLAIAELLVAHGADVNDAIPVAPNNDHQLSALYGAIGHANNMRLGRWLLEQGANPNDGESLYHATELGHHDGLRMLLEHGADPTGTNALYRAMDFHDVTAVKMLLDAGAKVEDYNGEEVGGETPWVIPALFQAARRGSPPEMFSLLIEHGADINARHKGARSYAFARVYGNTDLAQALLDAGAHQELTDIERSLATAADGNPTPGALSQTEIPEPYTDIIREILHLPGKLEHVRNLVTLGLDADRPDAFGLTPLQIAGWEGLPDVMEFLLTQDPDLSHINGYGGTLISTILHGSENNPDKTGRAYSKCLLLALEAGAMLTQNEIRFSGHAELAELLQDWAIDHPDQVA